MLNNNLAGRNAMITKFAIAASRKMYLLGENGQGGLNAQRHAEAARGKEIGSVNRMDLVSVKAETTLRCRRKTATTTPVQRTSNLQIGHPGRLALPLAVKVSKQGTGIAYQATLMIGNVLRTKKKIALIVKNKNVNSNSAKVGKKNTFDLCIWFFLTESFV